MTSEPKRRPRRIHILKDDGKPYEELDLWPGDEVWLGDLTHLGSVNEDGVFVSGPHVGLG